MASKRFQVIPLSPLIVVTLPGVLPTLRMKSLVIQDSQSPISSQGETNVDFIHPGVGPIDDGRLQEVAYSQFKKELFSLPHSLTFPHDFVLA